MRIEQFRNGFSLIETAIVLGVVGIVIGGIWVASASVMENKRIADTQEDVLQLVSNLRAKYRGFSLESLPAGDSGIYISFDTTAFANLKSIRRVDDYTVVGAWGNTIEALYRRPSDGDEGFQLDIEGLPTKACMRLAAFFGSATVGAELWRLDTAVNYPTTFPFMPTAADCPAGGSIALRFKAR